MRPAPTCSYAHLPSVPGVQIMGDGSEIGGNIVFAAGSIARDDLLQRGQMPRLDIERGDEGIPGAKALLPTGKPGKAMPTGDLGQTANVAQRKTRSRLPQCAKQTFFLEKG